MSPGTQIRCPVGFSTLTKMIRYHVVHTDAVHDRVVLAHFTAKPRKADLAFINIKDFLRGREQGLIQVLQGKEGVKLPEWLADRCDEVFDDTRRTDLSDGSVMKNRLAKALHASYEFERIFSSLDPERELRAIATKLGTNGQRYVRDTITFFAFDQNPDVLRVPTGGRGTYKREVVAQQGGRTGRTHRKGRKHGWDVTAEMKTMMEKGWCKFARRNRTLKRVWIKTLVAIFKCNYRKSRTRTEIWHPEGKPFPTYGQFRYWMLQCHGHEGVWMVLLGEIEYRNRFPVPKGSYHEGVRDLLEKVYSDATALDQLPRSLFDEAASMPVYEVPVIDGLSGITAGVMWGEGSESNSLYRQALATVGMRKSLVGEVLGIEISDEDYPVSGIMPRSSQTDQGAGAAKKIRELNKKMGIAPAMTPAYSPQTNSPVEGPHPRSVETSGPPVHEVSKLTAVGMAKQAFLRIMAENRSRDISGRLPPGVLKTIRNPMELWIYLRQQGRIQGKPVTDEEVILEYLPQVTFKMRKGQLTRNGVIYRSQEFSETKVGKFPWNYPEGHELPGRAFDISNRVEWVIVDRRLIKVKSVSAMQEHEDHFVMSARDLAVHGRAKLEAASDAKDLQAAEALRLEIDAKAETGHSYRAATMKKGRAKPRRKRRAAANTASIS